MQISGVSHDDGRRCANLIAFLGKGRWDLSASDAEELLRIKKWVHDLALGMAGELKKESPAPAPVAPAPATSGMRVRSISPITSPGTKRRKK